MKKYQKPTVQVNPAELNILLLSLESTKDVIQNDIFVEEKL